MLLLLSINKSEISLEFFEKSIYEKSLFKSVFFCELVAKSVKMLFSITILFSFV